MILVNLEKGGHRDDWNNILKELNPNLKPVYFIKNFINIFKLIRIKNLIFSSLSDGMIYILIVSFLRKIFLKKTRFIYFTRINQGGFKQFIYKIYIFLLQFLGNILFISSLPSAKKDYLVDLNFIDLNIFKPKSSPIYDIGYFGAVSDDKNFEGFVRFLNQNHSTFKNAIISSYNINHDDISQFSNDINIKIIKKAIPKDEFVRNLLKTNFIWAAYKYNQTSGIFGACYQLGLNVIVKKEGYLNKLNYKNSFIIENDLLVNSFEPSNKIFLIDKAREILKWKESIN